MDKAGAGKRFMWPSELTVTGDNDLPNVFTVFNKVNFPNLTFVLDNNNLFDFDEDTGIFIFKLSGHLQILATLNFDAGGISEVQISPAFKRPPGAWTFLNARRAGLPITGQNHVFMSGSVDVFKDDQLRFELKATNLLAKFDTEVLTNVSTIPAAVIDFKIFPR
jgi:hypothetical protein